MQDEPGRPAVRGAVVADIPSLVSILVRAFADDPVANFMFAGDRRRQRGLHAFFTSQLGHEYLPHGHVYTTAAGDGAALWGPPDVARNGLKELLHLLPAAPYLVSSHIHRALGLLFEVDGLRPKEPHWYLATLGVEPPRQGHGVGSALLLSTLDRIDESGRPAYLESSKERNVPFYARFGFEVVEELHPEAGTPTVWRMWREPRVPGS
ncbi:MAG: GNAT family N-acetyltransferase [Acidimicrobiales bacterium]